VTTDPDFELSIVMATYNRADTLKRTLDYLARQDIEPDRFELIIVDDASPDNTPEVVAGLIPELPYRVTFLRNETNRGPGYTQNRGIHEAVAPILMIMTDDVFMTPGALRAHMDFHHKNPGEEFAALGQVQQSTELDNSALMRNWDPFRFWLLEGVEDLPSYMFWACNVSCKRSFMEQHGMFKEHAGRGGPVAFEDLEVGYRLGLNGMKLHYLSQALAYHYHFYTIEQAEQRWYERGLNFGELREHVPDPVLTVYFHVLNARTFREYIGVLRGDNPFHGKERKISWHLIRHGIRMLVLNRITAALVWKPLLYGAEKSRALEKLVNRGMYRAYFYYRFLHGVSDAQRRYL